MCEHSPGWLRRGLRGASEAPTRRRGLASARHDGAGALPVAPLITAIMVVGIAAESLTACAVDLPAGFADRYSYEAVYETTQPPDTVVGVVRLTSARGDPVFGTFEDLDPDPGDVA